MNITPPVRGLVAGVGVLLAIVGVGVGVSSAQPRPGAAPMSGPAATAATLKVEGYLASDQVADSVRLLGPPPADGSGTKTGDVATFRATRSLEGSPRWALAARDADYGPAPMMRAMSCAANIDLDPAAMPALFHLLSRAAVDAETSGHQAKAAFRRPRPFVENGGGTICVAAEDWLKKSYSYPSGHSTFSWTAGLILAQVAPDRSTAILSRARAYGESRVVCGVHYPSDIQAGRTVASALFSALQDNAVYRADLERARAELARARAASPGGFSAERCAVEAQASATPVW